MYLLHFVRKCFCYYLFFSWGITHRIDGVETLLALQEDETIKYHVFVRVLVQVRGRSMSVDVNESPVFTNVRLSSGEAFDGLPGFCAEVLMIWFMDLLFFQPLIGI